MKNTETGEFELVMGTGKLLSGFFIVCVLFGVAFAMGYIVGRSSSPSAKALSEMQTPAPAPIVSDRPSSAPRDDSPPPESPPQAMPEAAPTATEPARETSPAAAEPPPVAIASEPGSGSYWQVMAVKQTEADVVLRTLKDKGFPGSLSPGPNGLVRVLVGPYSSRDALGKAKSELEGAGFHPILKK